MVHHLRFQKLLEEDTMLYSIEHFCSIQQAAVHNASIPDVLINCLVYNPAAQRCATDLLGPELKVITFEKMAIIEEDDPIKQLEDEQANCYRSIIR